MEGRGIARSTRDPWRRAPVGELGEQLLPRWFVVLGLVMVVVAIAALVAAFVVFGPQDVPPAARRPPPGGGLTHDVGAYQVGASQPVEFTPVCPLLQGVHVAGTEQDQDSLRRGLAALCRTQLPASASAAIEAFAGAGGVVRFAQFEATGVDSAAVVDATPPLILVNARFARTEALWIAPVVAHDAVMLAGDAAAAEDALQARQVEDAVCDQVLSDRRASRGCVDAALVVSAPDPLADLRAAGYR